jgi:hypothetical protein
MESRHISLLNLRVEFCFVRTTRYMAKRGAMSYRQRSAPRILWWSLAVSKGRRKRMNMRISRI